MASETFGSSLTNAGDDLRTGWYPNEPSLTPQLVTGGTFGQLWSTPVEGQVYAQPLLDDGRLFVATEENKIYGLNPATGGQEWSRSLGTPWNPAEIGCEDLTPDIGITATPVIDPATNVAYFTYKTYVSGSSGPARWYMDAVSVATGATQAGFPVELGGDAQNATAQSFTPATELQRPGLLLMKGVIYAAFGSDCDTKPWRGWVFGVSTGGEVKARWTPNETEEGAGIWQSGAGLTSDGEGRILLSTGNGGAPTTPAPGASPPANLGESIVQLQVQPDGSLKAVDFFAPFNASSLDIWDADFASGGVTGLPNEYFGTESTPHLAVAVGKDGYVYLLNRDQLGGIGQGSGGADAVVQQIGPYGGVWSRPGVWPGEGGWIYIPTASGGESSAGSSGNLRVYQYGLSGSGTPSLSLQGTSKEPFGFSSSSPVITSDGTTPGTALVWIVWAPNASGVGAQLRAYYPVPKNGEPVMAWSAPVGTAAKFAPPGVAAGRLYVGTRDGHVLAFGSPVTPALEGSATSFPTTTDGQSSQKTLKLTANKQLKIVKLAASSSQFQVGEPSIALPAELKTGEEIEVPITFAPTGTGPIGGMLTVSFDVGTTEETTSLGLSGTGQAAAAKLERTPPLVSFGGTSIGGELSAGATFRNVGGTPLTIENVAPPSAPFGAEGVPGAGSELQPGGSITITVTFKPTEVGDFESAIGLETSAGKAAVGLSGSASTPGQLRFSREKVEYGQVSLGDTVSETFTIENAGGTTVTITKSKPPDGGEFHATSTLGEGTTIKPGESLNETVAFSPAVARPAVPGVWHITGDDTTGPHEIEFDGVGLSTLTTPLPEGHTEMLGPGLASQPSPPPQSAHATSVPVPDVTLANLKLRARRQGTVSVRLSCPSGVGRCNGTITLSASRKVHGRQPASRSQTVSITLASGSFSLAGGSTTLVRLRFSKQALALLAHVHVLHAIATIIARDPAGAEHTARQHATITDATPFARRR